MRRERGSSSSSARTTAISASASSSSTSLAELGLLDPLGQVGGALLAIGVADLLARLAGLQPLDLDVLQLGEDQPQAGCGELGVVGEHDRGQRLGAGEAALAAGSRRRAG